MNQQDGYSLVETVVALVLGSVLLFAFYDLSTSGTRLSQETLERTYAYNMASRWIDQGRYIYSTKNVASYDSTSLSVPFKYQPQARGAYDLVITNAAYSGNLYLRTVTVTYGPPQKRLSIQLKAFIRYDGGGLYYN